MTTHRLIGVTTPQAADKLIALGASLAGDPLAVVRYPGLAALLTPAKRAGFFQTRKEALSDILQFQRQLEAAHGAGTLVPGAFANPLIDETEALRVLAVGHARFTEALATFDGVRQYQVTIGWNPAIALAHCATQAPFQAALSKVGPDKKIRGAAIRDLMEAERARLGAAAMAKLKAASLALMQEPLQGETMLANLVVLVKRTEEALFDTALEEVDASFPDLAIKQLGPLPPVSFAAIQIERPRAQDIAKAKLTLSLDAVEAEALKAAYRNAMKTAHPDAGGDAQRAAAITKAYRLLQRLDEANSAGGDRQKPLLVDLVNAGGERWAA